MTIQRREFFRSLFGVAGVSSASTGDREDELPSLKSPGDQLTYQEWNRLVSYVLKEKR